jgi:hypothetical protein
MGAVAFVWVMANENWLAGWDYLKLTARGIVPPGTIESRPIERAAD